MGRCGCRCHRRASRRVWLRRQSHALARRPSKVGHLGLSCFITSHVVRAVQQLTESTNENKSSQQLFVSLVQRVQARRPLARSRFYRPVRCLCCRCNSNLTANQNRSSNDLKATSVHCNQSLRVQARSFGSARDAPSDRRVETFERRSI